MDLWHATGRPTGARPTSRWRRCTPTSSGISASDLAAATGRSRFTIHRAFTAMYGIAPSDYQRQLRLRAARRLIAQGLPLSDAAIQAGFADQSHLTRWFSRY